MESIVAVDDDSADIPVNVVIVWFVVRGFCPILGY